MNKTLIVAAALSALALGGLSQVAAAADHDTPWQKHHPRREQVNERLAHQNQRIRTEVKEGEMSQATAARLHRDDRRIRQEERDMAAQDGSHLTKSEQKVLNQQESKVSRQIGA